MDDLHRRFDDLRADIAARFATTDKRIDDLRADISQRLTDMNQRLTDMHGTLRTFMWVVSGWFTFLTAVLAVSGFLRR
mgnify:CR=1 FL=1